MVTKEKWNDPGSRPWLAKTPSGRAGRTGGVDPYPSPDSLLTASQDSREAEAFSVSKDDHGHLVSRFVIP